MAVLLCAKRATILLLLAAGCTSANGGGSSDAGALPDATFVDASSRAVDAGGSCPMIAIDGGVVDFIDRIASAMSKYGGADSNAVIIPSSSDRDAFATNVVAILSGGSTCALPASYRIGKIVDGGIPYVVVAEMDASGNPTLANFWGTFIAPSKPFARVIVEAPHPLFDLRTEHEAADLFIQLQAGALLVAGAHRCADSVASDCSGTTDACGSTAPYRISDAAHSVVLPFAAVHDAISSATTVPFLQLHGNTEPCPSALVSDGSGSFADAGLVATFAASLEDSGVAVGRCGLDFPSGGCDLCATDNVQARFTAGAVDACTQMGTSYARFVHIEQQPALRDFPDSGVTGYEPVIRAAAATFAP
jgi:hypothetical protein